VLLFYSLQYFNDLKLSVYSTLEMTDTPVTLELLAKEIKALRKDVRKIRQFIGDPTGEKAAERAKTNGFNKPQNVTPELSAFLGLAEGEQISRSQVTKRINAYVAERELKNGQLINLDDTLRSLLNPPADTVVTFLNLQKFINPHYIKPVAVPKEPKPSKEPKEPSPPKEIKEKKVRPKVAKQ